MVIDLASDDVLVTIATRVSNQGTKNECKVRSKVRDNSPIVPDVCD